MGFSCGLVIGLSILFGFVLIAFLAEIFYLLWWKKRRQHIEIEIENQKSSSSSSSSNYPLSCFKNPNSPKPHQKDSTNCVQESEINPQELQPKGYGEESLDLELMRLHNLCGPPRFLFTINEETKEDLETESRKGGSRTILSELLCTPETPISSPLKTPQASNLEGYLNPLYDCCEANEFDFNKVRSSPPPTFKFLRDAEEKLLKRLVQLEAEKRASLKKKNQDCELKIEEKDGGFAKLVNDKGKKEGGIQNHNHNYNHNYGFNYNYNHHQMSTPSQVLPLPSSPSD